MTSSKRSPAVDAALFVLIILVPLAWTKLFVAEFTLAKLLTLNVGLALAAWGAAAAPKTLAGGVTALDYPLFACLAAAALSALNADDPATSLRGRYDSYAAGLWGLTLVAAVAQLGARAARGREEAPARLLLWAAVIVAAYAVLQRAGIDPVFRLKALPTRGRAVSTLGSPVDLGALLALLLPLALRRLDVERGALSVLCAATIAGGLLASGSRGALLAAGVGAVAYWLLSRRDPAKALPVATAVAGAAAALTVAYCFRPGAAASTDATRVEVWKAALEAFTRRPFLGWGPDGFEDAFKLLRSEAFVTLSGSSGHYQAYAHNELLHVLSSLGLVGAAAYAWLLASLYGCARRALQDGKNRAPAAALAAGLLALGVNLALNPVALEVWTLAAVCAGLLVSRVSGAGTAELPRPPLLILAVLATLSFSYAARGAWADATYKRGAWAHAKDNHPLAKSEIAAARKLAPCELSYITGELNDIADWINATRSAQERLELLARADRAAADALNCHPGRSTAHYAAANASRMHADLGFVSRLGDAARELDKAIALDPLFEPLLKARRDVATELARPR